jgi:purine-nucleoside phosphorylase
MNREVLLVLAAFPPELAGLEARPGLEVACTGVGALAAAIETTRLLSELRPTRVLFVGTCGAYDARLEVGDHLAVSRVHATSLEEAEGRGYRPSIECSAWEADWNPGLPAHEVAVTPAITRTEEGARVLAGLAAVEHLELSGVFAACKAAGVPVAAALAVANGVGPDAHTEWLAHHARVSASLMARLEALSPWPSASAPAEP